MPLLFLGIALLIFLPFSAVTWRLLTRLHPRRRALITTLVILGNTMWLFMPLMRSFTPFSRMTRAVFGPMWFGWTVFAILFTVLMLVVFLTWLPVRKRRPFARAARPVSA